MKHIGQRILSMAIAFTLAFTFPLSGTAVSAAETTPPAKPSLPDGFSSQLEENNGLTLASGAISTDLAGCGKALEVKTHWNNKNECHASIKDTAPLKSSAFTILFDFKQSTPSSDPDKADRRSALSIGNNANSLHLLTYSGKFGYGGGEGGVSKNHVDNLPNVTKDGWNAVAMTYEEKNGGNGHVILYINGQKSAEVTDIGFKLSTMTDLSAMLARSFNTSYLQEGVYDNIVIGTSVLNESSAIAETAYRKYAKEGLQSNIPPETVLIKGSDIDKAAKNINGLTYKGFGMLNGNSTSNLLLEYKDKAKEKYDAMMQYLFGGDYPLFTHIKMEMGNDGNNSTGAESCTMRYENEEADASRSPGFVMAADAKKINPAVKISILRWEMPKWAEEKWNSDRKNAGYEAVYKWYKETIFDAYEKYGYVVDFVNPDKNETSTPDADFIKWYSNRIKQESDFPSYMDDAAKAAYKKIRIIASDENKSLNIVPNMRSDSNLYKAVDIIGFHYRTNATDDYVKMADVDDKEVWYSEGCATFGYSELQENKTTSYGAKSIGGYQSPLALMDSFITAFESSRRTHYMFQPAIGSFYEGIQYGHKELLSARDPWSGYIHYDPALYMLEHFAKFAKTGWEDSDPSKNEIWRAIPAATKAAFAGSDNEHATAGIDGKAGYLTMAAPDKSDFSVIFVNNTRNEKTYQIQTEGMESAAAKDLHFWLTETDQYMQDKNTLTKSENGWSVTLPAYSVATVTTLSTVPERTPEEGIHNADRAVLDTDATGGKNGVTTDDILYADNFEYKEEAADFLKNRGNEPRYMLDAHGAWIVENGRLKQELPHSVAQWNGGDPSTIVGDFRWMDTVTSADMEIPDGAQARLTVRAQTGMNWNNSGYTICIDSSGKWELYRIGTKVAEGKANAASDQKYNVKIMALKNSIQAVINNKSVAYYTDPAPMLSGRVKLSSSWNPVYFDNLLVKTVPGGIPYASSMIDGQDDSVTYSGTWSIDNPGSGSADNWYRTLSKTTAANSSFSFPIEGSGFAIIGKNDGSAVLEVSVDGTVVQDNAPTVSSPARGETYILSDLSNGKHNIKITVKSGTLEIDALHTLTPRIANGEDYLVSVDAKNFPSISTIVPGETISNLPNEADVLTASGKTVKKAITWDASSNRFEGKEFMPAFITGTIQDGTTALGLPLTVSLPVGFVVPAKTVYFIDSVNGDPSKVQTTEPYEAVKALLGSRLLNEKYDQIKTADNTWGLVDQDAGTRGADNTKDQTATGIYGANNQAGETLSYAFTLPAGTYKIVSAHREWWGMNRPMKASLSYNGTGIDTGTINLSGSSGDIIHSAVFTLDKEELVTYTITCTGTEAPVISWLGVTEYAEHTHVYDAYKDNGNGTHTVSCKEDDDSKTENHAFSDGKCVCGAEDPSYTKDPEVKNIKFSSKALTLGAGEKIILKATVEPAKLDGLTIDWESSQPKVASVDSKGRVIAKKIGKTKITASAGGQTATCSITVKQAPSKILLTKKSYTLKRGQIAPISYKLLPKNSASNKITFTPSNKNVSVSSSGKIKGIKKGKAVVTLKTFNNKKITVRVTVK